MELTDFLLKFLGVNKLSNREFKGKSLLMLLDDYVVVDLETTGLMPSFDAIIEIGAIRFVGDIEVARFHSFVSIGCPLDPFIIEHTGITDDMLEGAPKIEEALPRLLEFIGDSVLIAHNAHFDVNFIYDDADHILNVKFSNNFVDTMRLARKCTLPVENHKLVTLANYFEIPQDTAHRSIADCETTHKLYVKLKEYAAANDISLKPKYYDTSVSGITATTTDIDTDNPFYGKVVVFTGALQHMKRKDAAQIVANLGGILSDRITQKTNFLVLGNFDYCSTVKEGKSNKYKMAEKLILQGQDLQIIPENVFLSMIAENQYDKTNSPNSHR